jgi:inosine-uridine nucleoside N-ribohydrolase
LPWDSRPANIFAANLMIESVHSNPGQVSVLSLGPMTNLALALRLDPGIVPLTRRIIVMGGSFNVQNPEPEFNARCDPEAAQIVFNAGWDVHILGLDITRRVHFSRADFSSLRSGHPAIDLLRAQAPGWIDRMEEMGWEQDGCALHDAVTAAYLADDSIFKTEETKVEVELSDPKLRGVTRFSTKIEDRPTVKVVTDVDVKKCRDLIGSHLRVTPIPDNDQN